MKNNFKKICCLFFLIVTLCVLPGCSEKMISVKIDDMLTQTQLSSLSGKTVCDILNEAEIKLGKKDKVTPPKDTVITKDTTITVSRYATSTVTYNGETKEISLLGATVSDALKKAKIKLSKNDYVNFNPAVYISDGMEIVVVRRLNVALTVEGKTKKYITDSKTVSDFLNEQGILLGKKDIVIPKQSSKLKENSKVIVKRVEEKKITKKEIAKYSTKYENSSSMSEGTSRVSVEGVNGEKKVTYRVVYVDGKEKSRKKIKETILKRPVDKVIIQGTKKSSSQTSSQKPSKSNGKTEVSRQRVDDCDGSGHGYYIIKYDDGSVKYQEY